MVVQGNAFEDAVRLVALTINLLPRGCLFNVIGFGSSFHEAFPRSVRFSHNVSTWLF